MANLLILFYGLLAVSGVNADPAKAAPHAAKARASGKGAISGAMTAAYNAYSTALRQKIDNNWYLADGKNKVTLTLNVGQDGSVTELSIASTPKNTEAEQAASDAFNKAQPLAALPAGSPPVRLTLVFSSNADPHGDNTRDISALIEPMAQQIPPNKNGLEDGSANAENSNESKGK